MYHKILVAYDGTGPSDAALRQGAELARLCKAELHVLAIVVSAGGMLLDPAVVSIELLETERQYLQEALADSIRDLGRQGANVRACIRDGDAAAEIVAHAREIKADLVVVGHSDKGLLARWFEGSVGTQLLDTMPCSLLIAKDGSHPSLRN
jgi:nucleotide-binding universal stress UspA family protein